MPQVKVYNARKIHERLRPQLDEWTKKINPMITTFDSIVKGARTEPLTVEQIDGMEKILESVSREMWEASQELHALRDVMELSKTEAEYRKVLVESYPSPKFFDRAALLGAGILTAGGVSFPVGGPVVAAVLWIAGGLMLAYALSGFQGWEWQRWRFFADQFNVDASYDPRVSFWRRLRPRRR